MSGSSAALPKEIKQVLNKVKAWWDTERAAFADASTNFHFAEYFNKKYPSMGDQYAILRKIQDLIKPVQHVGKQVPAGEDNDVVFSLDQFRLDMDMSLKGVSWMPDCIEKLEMIFPDGLKSNMEKIVVFFHQPALAPVGPQCIQLRNGMAKIVGCYMIAVCAATHLTPEEQVLAWPALRSFGEIHCVWNNVRDVKSALFGSIALKIGRAATQRPDPGQLLKVCKKITDQRRQKDLALDAQYSETEYNNMALNEYNDAQPAEVLKIDNYERKATNWLAEQSEECQKIVIDCWAGPGKYTESAINYRDFSKAEFQLGTCLFECADSGDLEWKRSVTTSRNGYTTWAKRCRASYLAKLAVMTSQAKGNKVNLRSCGNKLREADTEKSPLLVCTWWGNKLESLKALLGAEYDGLEARFHRGFWT